MSATSPAGARARRTPTSSTAASIAAGPDGTRSILLWQDREPEEDPGIIDVLSVRPEADVWAGYDQDVEVTGDPRDLDLPLPAEDLLAAVSDPSVGLVASPEQLRAGDALTVWQD